MGYNGRDRKQGFKQYAVGSHREAWQSSSSLARGIKQNIEQTCFFLRFNGICLVIRFDNVYVNHKKRPSTTASPGFVFKLLG